MLSPAELLDPNIRNKLRPTRRVFLCTFSPVQRYRERLDRHLALKTAGSESGETNAFYDAMHLQGTEGEESGGAGGAALGEPLAPDQDVPS